MEGLRLTSKESFLPLGGCSSKSTEVKESLFQNDDDGFKELTDKLEKKGLIKSSRRIRKSKLFREIH